MIKRTLLTLGLGLGLTGGVLTATHVGSPVRAHPAAGQAAAAAPATPAKAAVATEDTTDAADPETDTTAPCKTDAAGVQTGDCQDGQDTTGAADAADSTGKPVTTGPDADTADIQN